MRIYKGEIIGITPSMPSEQDEQDELLRSLNLPTSSDYESKRDLFEVRVIPFTLDLDTVTGCRRNAYDFGELNFDCTDVFFGGQYLIFNIPIEKFEKIWRDKTYNDESE